MATASVETLNARVEVSPYTGLTAIQRQQSGIARAQVSLVWDQTILSATSSGSIKGVSFQGSLPRNFAYVYYGGSIELGRVANSDVLNQLLGGCLFENLINATIQGNGQQDSWTLEVAGVTKQETDINVRLDASTVNILAPATDGSSVDAQYATAGSYDPYSDVYKKIYNDVDPPKIIYRGTDDDIDVFANVACMVLDPFPASEFLALGRMHFLQYDIDQAYNYLIHSPIPVR